MIDQIKHFFHTQNQDYTIPLWIFVDKKSTLHYSAADFYAKIGRFLLEKPRKQAILSFYNGIV